MAASSRSPRARGPQGLTLVELVLAMVVIGVGLAGVLLAWSSVARGSADPLVQRQMQAIAEELIEEIALKPYAAAAHAAPSTDCARDTWNDIGDYAGYATTGRICSIDGLPIAALAGYSVRVAIEPVALGGISAARRISVTVSRSGSADLTLRTWRTDYAS
jgi:MSHA pilin protein MshD